MIVGMLNDYLDKLNTLDKINDKANLLRVLLVKYTTAQEQQWIVRIILKDLKISMSEKTVLNSFHEDALELFQYNSSLKKVCDIIVDRSKKYLDKDKHSSISIFNAIKPMLAARKHPDEISKIYLEVFLITYIDLYLLFSNY